MTERRETGDRGAERTETESRERGDRSTGRSGTASRERGDSGAERWATSSPETGERAVAGVAGDVRDMGDSEHLGSCDALVGDVAHG